FLIAIGQALVRGLDIRCGCYGTIDAEPIGARKLVENFGMLLVAGWLVWREKK
ncbi:DoxX family protein, partial [bacterium]|nr:DoxX family protein [bacterium]